MDYKRVLRLHFVNHLSGREIAESCGDCSKTTVNEFLKRFRKIRNSHTLYRQMLRMNTLRVFSIKSLVYQRTIFSIGILTRKLSTRL